MLRALPHILLFKCVPNFGEGQVVLKALSRPGVRPTRNPMNRVTDWTHTQEPDVSTKAHFRWIQCLVFFVSDCKTDGLQALALKLLNISLLA
jgi:hypothetical protein